MDLGSQNHAQFGENDLVFSIETLEQINPDHKDIIEEELLDHDEQYYFSAD